MADDAGRRRLQAQLELRVSDPRVRAAMLATPRDLYVLPEWTDEAWDDRALPHLEGQTISQPSMVAIMLDALEPKPDETVLDVGTGSGYQAAILARLVRRVLGIELRRTLARWARHRLARDPGVPGNVHVTVGDAHRGFPGRVSFDGILVAAAADRVPPALVDQLGPGGRLLAPIGPPGLQELVRVRRDHAGGLHTEELGACAFVPLVHR